MANASLEDCQLLAESEILQRDLFVAAKDQKNHPKKREGCVQHEAGSVSASSQKINRVRDRWDLARHRCVLSNPECARASVAAQIAATVLLFAIILFMRFVTSGISPRIHASPPGRMR